MAVGACVQAILCPLGNAVTGALSAIINGQIAVLQATSAAITAQLAVIEVELVPVTALEAVVSGVIEEVRAVGNLVPVAVMAGCFDLGDMTSKLNDSLDLSLASANAFLEDLNRSLSFKAELSAKLVEINDAIQKFEAINLAIAGCST